MLRIGIITLFQGNLNWGGVLQGYALKTLLENTYADAQVDLLLYHGGYSVVYPTRWKQMLQYSPIQISQQLLKRFTADKRSPMFNQCIQARKKLFMGFELECTTNNKQYANDNLPNAAQEYDCLICGSDQIWNPNVARPGFFLQGVSDKCIKIAYAASIARSGLTKHERAVMMPLIARFDAISVREKSAKIILERDLSKNHPVFEVLDPALMLPRENWEKLISDIPSRNEKYALAFFFSDSMESRGHIQNYCEAHHLALKMIPFATQKYLAADEQGSGEREYNVGPYEFIRLLHDAQCVFTDSFHGAVFSILFHKPFGVFERDKHTKVSKNVRLYDLLDKFGLLSRLITDMDMLTTIIDTPIMFDHVETLINDSRRTSFTFLTDAISMAPQAHYSAKPQNTVKETTVAYIPREACLGCGACKAICPQKAVEMKADQEGFAYPRIDESKCVHCGICLQRCIGYYKDHIQHKEPLTYLGYHKQEMIRMQSSSGGVFYALAKNILAKGGVIYGAAMDDAFCVRHIRALDERDLKRVLTSKYVQSDIGAVYSPLLQDLKKGIPVLFAGTPCQVAAIKRYALGKSQDQLPLLVDFVCHGVPSPTVWKSYLRYIGQTGEITDIQFRSKEKGWHNYHFAVQYRVGKRLSQSHEKNPYMCTFLSDRNLRPSCYSCGFKAFQYESDITLADAWKIEKEFPQWADDKGTSLIIARTSKGIDICKEISSDVEMRESDYYKWGDFNPSLMKTTKEPASRPAFFESFQTNDDPVFWKQQGHISFKKHTIYTLKQIVRKTGLDVRLRRRF